MRYDLDSLPSLSPRELHQRRERVFLVLAGLFLGTLAMLNILGISRFIAIASWTSGENGYDFDWGTFGDFSVAVAVGVLPYPLTFLCTDLISELYGRRRANFLVWVGLIINLWVVAIMWLGGVLPP
ncbi:MAG: VUT family protein, partial [Phycisphaeraceae bacterium]|nr:VUT family protein [Phycisphaeraceae bacterium]